MKEFLFGAYVGLTATCGYLLHRISVVSHRVDVAIMVQQSQQNQIDELKNK